MKANKTISFSSFLILLFFSCQRNIQGPGELSFAWPAASPESQNIDNQILDAAFDAASARSFINGVVVVRNGYLVSERYNNGFEKNDIHNIRSVSKSFLSALIGIAIEQGAIIMDTKIMDYFSEYAGVMQDGRVYDATIGDLLTMRGGFPGDRDSYFLVTSSEDWIRTTLSQQLLFNPGSAFKYSTAGTHLLSAILTKAVGQSSLEFATENLFKPLGITVHDWNRDPQGYYFGGTDMSFTIRDIARFGQLYLDNGKLEESQLIPRSWVDQSLKPSYTSHNGSWGDLDKIAYGRLWWLGEIQGRKVQMALGHGGQFVLLFPELNLIVAACSKSDVDWDVADEQERGVLAVVANSILPAVRE
jgi:CubicO group peptidase (beta-lactamase class C family)